MRCLRTVAVLTASLFSTQAMGQQMQAQRTPVKSSSTERGKQMLDRQRDP